MIIGTVKSFQVGPDKNFGFITDTKEGGPISGDVFFHAAFGGKYVCDGSDTPVFLKCEVPPPEMGDRIIFTWDVGPRGPRAKMWALLSTMNLAWEEIKARKAYKLIQRTGRRRKNSKLHSDLDPKFSTLWEGTNIQALRIGFPDYKYRLHDEDYSALYFKVKAGETWMDTDEDPRLTVKSLEMMEEEVQEAVQVKKDMEEIMAVI